MCIAKNAALFMQARAASVFLSGLVLLGAPAQAADGDRAADRKLERASTVDGERAVESEVERVHSGPLLRVVTGAAYFSGDYDGALAPCVLCTERHSLSSQIEAPAFIAEGQLGWGYQGWMFGARVRVLMPFEWSMTVESRDDPIDPEPFTVLMLGLFVDWYPDPEEGFHVMLVPSFTTASLSDAENRLADNGVLHGPAIGVGVGYQFWLPGAASLGLLAGGDLGWLRYQDPGGMELENKKLAFVSAGVAIELTVNGEEKTQ
jgi:hypothetical protein